METPALGETSEDELPSARDVTETKRYEAEQRAFSAQQDLLRVQSALRASERAKAGLQGQLAAVSARAALLEHLVGVEKQELQRWVNQLTAQKEAITTSRSWQMTAPLRAVMRRLRQVRARL